MFDVAWLESEVGEFGELGARELLEPYELRELKVVCGRKPWVLGRVDDIRSRINQ